MSSTEASFQRFRAGLSTRLRRLTELSSALRDEPLQRGAVHAFLGELHTFKGEARVLGLDSLVAIAHRLEDEFAHDPRLTWSVAQRALRDLQRAWDESAAPAPRSHPHEPGGEAEASAFAPIELTLSELGAHAQRLAASRERLLDVQIRTEGLQLARDFLEELKEPLLHLVHNAVDHGIEPHAERGDKPAAGRLRLTARNDEQTLFLSVEDDGRGIDLEAVRNKAVSKGFLTPDQARIASEAALFDVLFEHGFSTRDQVDSLSGRGVGLQVVRRKLESLGGRIEVTSIPGQGTRFLLVFPHYAERHPRAE